MDDASSNYIERWKLGNEKVVLENNFGLETARCKTRDVISIANYERRENFILDGNRLDLNATILYHLMFDM